MRHLLALLGWIALALPAHAGCEGNDLRGSLLPEERAALADALAAQTFPEGNHWRATRGGTVIHLIGTMHLDDPRFDAVAARIAPVVAGADTLLLEMTQTEQRDLQRAVTARPDLMLMQGATLPELLEEAEWDRLSEALSARGVPPFMASRFRPWYVATLLALPACLTLDGMAGGGLDARLERMAEAAQVPVRALEPFDTAFRAFEAVPTDLQLTMLRASLAAPAAAEDLFATLVEAYFEEAHAESWLVTQILGPRLSGIDGPEAEAANALVTDLLLERRNRAWLPVILDTAAAAEGPVVAAFGAGHLSGPSGILALLEAEGFALERQPF